MIRLVKRYGGGSRKLYDTEESRYVSLDEIAIWVRAGQQLKVVDSATAEDVTAQTLAQVIYEGHRAGRPLVSTEFLHEAIRRGGQALTQGVEQLQARANRLVRDFPPTRAARTELASLRKSLAALQTSLEDLESMPVPARRRGGNGRKARRAGAGASRK